LGLFVQRDEWVPNGSNLVLAKAIGLPIAKPHLALELTLPEVDGSSGSVVGTAGTPFAALLEQSFAEHGGNVTSKNGTRRYQAIFPHYDSGSIQALFPKLGTAATFQNPMYASLTSVASFFRTALAGGAIQVDGVGTPVNIPDGQ
jgi:hypothetical protein